MSFSDDEIEFWLGYNTCKAKEPMLVSGNVTPAGGDGIPAMMQSPPGSAKFLPYNPPRFERSQIRIAV